MTNEQINIAIAEACGWSKVDGDNGLRPDGIFTVLPDYCNDLNAMHEAEKVLTYFPDYLFHLREIVGPFPDAMSEWSDYHWQDVVHATARQRAEAFLRTLGKWEETK